MARLGADSQGKTDGVRRVPHPFLAILLLTAMAAACGQSPPVMSVRAGGMRMSLETQPFPPLSRREVVFRLRVEEAGRPLAGGAAALDLAMPGMNHGPNRVDLRERAPGVYEGTGILVMAGPWQATADLRHRGGRVAAVFRFTAPR